MHHVKKPNWWRNVIFLLRSFSKDDKSLEPRSKKGRWWGFANWLSRLQTANSASSGRHHSSPKQNTLWRRMITRVSYRPLRISLRGECRGYWEILSAWAPVSGLWLVGLALPCFCLHFQGWVPERIEALSCFVPAQNASLWPVKAFSVSAGSSRP